MNRDYDPGLSFTDVAFCQLICFVCLFSVMFLLVSKKNKQEAKVNSKAEFMITVEWPSECQDDVDTWVEDPLGNLVFFRRREEGLMHLDRDDLGWRNDRITLADGTIYEVKENKEIVTIRGIIPGEYCVNTHMYLKKDFENTKVKIKIEKLNPVVKIVDVKEVTLKRSGEEQTIIRFTLDKKGYITDVNRIQKPLAATKLGVNTHDGNHYDDWNGEDEE